MGLGCQEMSRNRPQAEVAPGFSTGVPQVVADGRDEDGARGSHVHLVRYDGYYRKDEPHLDEIIYRVIPDAASRTLALENGTVQLAQWSDVEFYDVARLKDTEGGPIIVHGSATLGHHLADAGLVDRYHLLVFPVLLGAGKRLFSDTDKDLQRLSLVASEAYGNGIQKLVYDVLR